MGIKELIEERRKIHNNKKLIKEFPFLLPKNRWTGEPSKDYDYTYTELDAMPDGWRKAFGLDMCNEIKEELIRFNSLNDYRITEIKEKYGFLHWYDAGQPAGSKIDKIISKYEDLSICYCVNCGKPVRYFQNIYDDNQYICEDCRNYLVDNNYYKADKFIPINEEFIPERTTYKDGIEEKWDTGIDFKKYWGLK